jgi:hypothetical protein
MTDGLVDVMKVIKEIITELVLEIVKSLVMNSYTLVMTMSTNVVVKMDILMVITKLVSPNMLLNVEEIVTGVICKNILPGVKMVMIIILVFVLKIGITIL